MQARYGKIWSPQGIPQQVAGSLRSPGGHTAEAALQMHCDNFPIAAGHYHGLWRCSAPPASCAQHMRGSAKSHPIRSRETLLGSNPHNKATAQTPSGCRLKCICSTSSSSTHIDRLNLSHQKAFWKRDPISRSSQMSRRHADKIEHPPPFLLMTVAMVLPAAAADGMGVLSARPPLATVFSTACFVCWSSSTIPSGEPACIVALISTVERGRQK